MITIKGVTIATALTAAFVVAFAYGTGTYLNIIYGW